MPITEWAFDDRPREKMRDKGASVLSNAELLAILVGSGTPKMSAVEMMQGVLASCDNSLRRLSRMTISELCKFSGIGEAKAITILAACELCVRREMEGPLKMERLSSAEDISRIFRPLLRDLPVEQCWVLLLNQQNGIISRSCVSIGGISATAVDVRCILRLALMNNATGIALCHNHPSGGLTPSKEDDSLTSQVSAAAKVMNIRFVDHVIVAETGYYSYLDNGRL